MRTIIFLLCMTTALHAENSVTVDQVGNNNNTTIIQSTPDASATIKNNGDSNDFWILQQGEGKKDVIIDDDNNDGATNSNNSFNILQTGPGNHSATITMVDPTANSNNNATITQSGPNKTFTLNIQGSGISATVSQTNPTVGDTGSMSIQCYTGTCSGYSYTRN